MKLKCVGGACDGKVVPVHENPRPGDAVRVINYPKFLSPIEPAKYEDQQFVEMEFHIYAIDCFKWSHSKTDITEIWFLRPKNFTTLDAIQFQFNKV